MTCGASSCAAWRGLIRPVTGARRLSPPWCSCAALSIPRESASKSWNTSQASSGAFRRAGMSVRNALTTRDSALHLPQLGRFLRRSMHGLR
jgi:hypothetical protein